MPSCVRNRWCPGGEPIAREPAVVGELLRIFRILHLDNGGFARSDGLVGRINVKNRLTL